MGLVRGLGKLARHGDDLVARHAGDGFLPRRGVGAIAVIRHAGLFARQTTVHAVAAGQQVEHGGHHYAAFGLVPRQLQM
ncbi:hypothetical protein D3C71_1614900 [compost metagenome]